MLVEAPRFTGLLRQDGAAAPSGVRLARAAASAAAANAALEERVVACKPKRVACTPERCSESCVNSRGEQFQSPASTLLPTRRATLIETLRSFAAAAKLRKSPAVSAAAGVATAPAADCARNNDRQPLWAAADGAKLAAPRGAAGGAGKAPASPSRQIFKLPPLRLLLPSLVVAACCVSGTCLALPPSEESSAVNGSEVVLLACCWRHCAGSDCDDAVNGDTNGDGGRSRDSSHSVDDNGGVKEHGCGRHQCLCFLPISNSSCLRGADRTHPPPPSAEGQLGENATDNSQGSGITNVSKEVLCTGYMSNTDNCVCTSVLVLQQASSSDVNCSLGIQPQSNEPLHAAHHAGEKCSFCSERLPDNETWTPCVYLHTCDGNDTSISMVNISEISTASYPARELAIEPATHCKLIAELQKNFSCSAVDDHSSSRANTNWLLQTLAVIRRVAWEATAWLSSNASSGLPKRRFSSGCCSSGSRGDSCIYVVCYNGVCNPRVLAAHLNVSELPGSRRSPQDPIVTGGDSSGDGGYADDPHQKALKRGRRCSPEDASQEIDLIVFRRSRTDGRAAFTNDTVEMASTLRSRVDNAGVDFELHSLASADDSVEVGDKQREAASQSCGSRAGPLRWRKPIVGLFAACTDRYGRQPVSAENEARGWFAFDRSSLELFVVSANRSAIYAVVLGGRTCRRVVPTELPAPPTRTLTTFANSGRWRSRGARIDGGDGASGISFVEIDPLFNKLYWLADRGRELHVAELPNGSRPTLLCRLQRAVGDRADAVDSVALDARHGWLWLVTSSYQLWRVSLDGARVERMLLFDRVLRVLVDVEGVGSDNWYGLVVHVESGNNARSDSRTRRFSPDWQKRKLTRPQTHLATRFAAGINGNVANGTCNSLLNARNGTRCQRAFEIVPSLLETLKKNTLVKKNEYRPRTNVFQCPLGCESSENNLWGAGNQYQREIIVSPSTTNRNSNYPKTRDCHPFRTLRDCRVLNGFKRMEDNAFLVDVLYDQVLAVHTGRDSLRSQWAQQATKRVSPDQVRQRSNSSGSSLIAVRRGTGRSVSLGKLQLTADTTVRVVHEANFSLHWRKPVNLCASCPYLCLNSPKRRSGTTSWRTVGIPKVAAQRDARRYYGYTCVCDDRERWTTGCWRPAKSVERLAATRPRNPLGTFDAVYLFDVFAASVTIIFGVACFSVFLCSSVHKYVRVRSGFRHRLLDEASDDRFSLGGDVDDAYTFAANSTLAGRALLDVSCDTVSSTSSFGSPRWPAKKIIHWSRWPFALRIRKPNTDYHRPLTDSRVPPLTMVEMSLLEASNRKRVRIEK